MSLWGRALAGVGAAGADIANKYIDEEITLQKMQALEDMRVQTAQRMDEYQYSPERQARVTKADAARETAIGQARADVDLRSKRNEATDTTLQSAVTKNAVDRAVAEAKARGKTMADLEIKYGNDPQMLAAIRKKAQAQHVESAGSLASAAMSRKQMEMLDITMKERERLGKLYDELGTIENDPKMTPEQKMAAARPKITQINAIKAKNSQTTPRDSKYDFDERETETIDPKTGTTTKTKTYAPRGAGGQPAEDPLMATLIAQREAKKKDGAAPPPLAERAKARVAAPIDQMAEMSTTDLQRIAAIPGHTNQKAAQAELARREQDAAAVDTSGFGYGTLPGQ